MKATTGPVPADDGWAFEIKWDGMRVVADVDATPRAATARSLTLTSASGRNATGQFPELDALTDHLAGHRVVLDGEVVVFDRHGRTDFGRLQPRMHTTGAKVAPLAAQVPVAYVLFDLLHLDGHDTVDLPYLDRRRLLTELVEPAASWTIPAHHIGSGHDLYEAAAERRLEGIIAKRVDSPYRPGKRSPAWRKCKVRRGQEVVVGGWTPGEGGRSSTIGSLLVGVCDPGHEGGPLRFAGGVGTGFTDAVLADLQRRMEALASHNCPFDPRPTGPHVRHARWVRPELVAQVEFGEWTGDGRLRHPSYIGLRADKDPADVVREPDAFIPPESN